MQKSTVSRIIQGGLIATTFMTIVMLMAPLMGMPKMLIGNMLAGFMHIPVVFGWIGHFMIGIMIAVGYVVVGLRLPGHPVVKGLLYSLIPFLMAQLIVMPMMGAGVFSSLTPMPMQMVLGSLIGHLVYGAVLGLTITSENLNCHAIA